MAKLPNYLCMHHKRLGLSQNDVACLLGVESGAKVCCYEKFNRLPRLEIILAHCAVFQRQPSELFDGQHDRIVYDIALRAEKLLKKAKEGKETRRKKTLAALVDYKPKKSAT